MALNKVIMVGRLCSDPELKQATSGAAVTSFSIALNRGEGKTDFFNVVAWKKTAEFITRYFHKGDGICIDGHLSVRSYEKDNVKHKVYEVVCDNAGFAEGRVNGEGGQMDTQARKTSQGENTGMDDVYMNGFDTVNGDEDMPF